MVLSTKESIKLIGSIRVEPCNMVSVGQEQKDSTGKSNHRPAFPGVLVATVFGMPCGHEAVSAKMVAMVCGEN